MIFKNLNKKIRRIALHVYKDYHIDELLKMFKIMKKRLLLYLLGLFTACGLFASYQILLAFVNKGMLNAVINKDQHGLVNSVLLLIFTLLAFCALFPSFIYLKQYSLKKTVTEVRSELFEHIIKLPITYFENQHSGDIISIINNDMNVFDSFYDMQFHSLILSTFWGIGSIIFMFTLDWRLSILMIILGIVSVIINLRYAKPLREDSNKIQSALSLLTQNFGDILMGFRVLKLFDISNLVLRKFVKESDAVAFANIERTKKNSMLNSANYLLNLFSLVGVLIVGSFMVASGSADFGSVLAIITLQNGVSNMFINLGYFFASIQSSLAGAQRVFEFFEKEREPENYITHSNKLLVGKNLKDNSIIFENITFSYEKKDNVLKGLSLKVGKGQIAALVGPSGGGKSTVIKLLLGLYPPDSGDVIINGKPLREYKLSKLRELVSYVPQDAYLFDGTIEENIRYGRLDATKGEVIAAAKGAHAHEFILESPDGYDTMVGERGFRLSGGQRQRIAIARALLKNAPILLLDEATSSLDSESEQLVQKALNELMKGRTTIAVAHRLSTIEHSDIIYVIDDGIVTEKGTHEDLISGDGLYKYLYELGSDEKAG